MKHLEQAKPISLLSDFPKLLICRQIHRGGPICNAILQGAWEAEKVPSVSLPRWNDIIFELTNSRQTVEDWMAENNINDQKIEHSEPLKGVRHAKKQAAVEVSL